jgi:hypothetical protein
MATNAALVLAGAPLTNIVIGATGVLAIGQNVQTILATMRGTLFLDRTFGVDGNMIDLPQPVARQRWVSDVIAQIEKQEPRVQVTGVSFVPPNPLIDAGNGVAIPQVTIKIRPGVLL